jgi:hypothetical protein
MAHRIKSCLGPGFEILRYDLRAHGESPRVRGPYILDDFVEDGTPGLGVECGADWLGKQEGRQGRTWPGASTCDLAHPNVRLADLPLVRRESGRPPPPSCGWFLRFTNCRRSNRRGRW